MSHWCETVKRLQSSKEKETVNSVDNMIRDMESDKKLSSKFTEFF